MDETLFKKKHEKIIKYNEDRGTFINSDGMCGKIAGVIWTHSKHIIQKLFVKELDKLPFRDQVALPYVIGVLTYMSDYLSTIIEGFETQQDALEFMDDLYTLWFPGLSGQGE